MGYWCDSHIGHGVLRNFQDGAKKVTVEYVEHEAEFPIKCGACNNWACVLITVPDPLPTVTKKEIKRGDKNEPSGNYL